MSEIVVIGAGVVGASVAWHLASRGCTDVVVVDAGRTTGEGSTGRATGGFRAQFGSDVNVRLSLLAREKLLRFEEEVGVDPGFRPCGYLFLATERRGMKALAEARATQRAAGFGGAREVTPEEIGRINPALRLDGVIGGSYSPEDGFIRPLEIARGYVEGAARMGVRFDWGERCRGFRMEEGRIAAVVTEHGEIPARRVVNAAGPWAAEVGRWAGVEVPVSPLRRQVARTAACDRLPETMPMSIWVDDGFHLRVRDGRVLLLWPDAPTARDPWDSSVDPAWVERVTRAARERVPCLEGVPIDTAGCWGGLYEMSPDGHALLGAAPGREDLFLANGSSGHGVMHAPALGHLLSEILLDGAAHTLDASPLRPERFAEGRPNRAPELL